MAATGIRHAARLLFQRLSKTERRIRVRLVMDLGEGGGAQNVPIWGRNMLDVYVTVRGEDLAVDPAAE
jgi:hypothetical protein